MQQDSFEIRIKIEESGQEETFFYPRPKSAQTNAQQMGPLQQKPE